MPLSPAWLVCSNDTIDTNTNTNTNINTNTNTNPIVRTV